MKERIAEFLKGVTLALLYIGIYISIQTGAFFVVELLEEDLLNYTGVVTIISSVASMGIYLVIFYLRDIDLKKQIRKRRLSLFDVIFSFTLAIGFRVLTGAYLKWAENEPFLAESLEAAGQDYNFSTMTVFTSVTIMLAVCVVAPIFEEILFRGIVFKELEKVMPAFAAILIQGIFFGVAHMVMVQSVFAIVYGIVLGVLYYKTKNIYITIIAHIFFNGSVILEIKDTQALLKPALTGAVVCAMSLVMFFYVYKRREMRMKSNLLGGTDNGRNESDNCQG